MAGREEQKRRDWHVERAVAAAIKRVFTESGVEVGDERR